MSKLPGQDRKELSPEEKNICDIILFNELESYELTFLGKPMQFVEIPYKLMKEYLQNKNKSNIKEVKNYV